MNRFDLEEQITACWQTQEDIKLLADSILESDLSKDDICNTLQGIGAIHDLRCKKLFDTFEYMLSEGLISNKDKADILYQPFH